MCGNCEIIPPQSEVIPEVFAEIKNLTPLEIAVTHRIENGVYTRSGKIPANTVILGYEHRARNVFHISKGEILVWDKFHGTRKLVAPFSEMTLPGTQRVGYALTEVEGCNIFETEKTTVPEIEAEMLFPFSPPSEEIEAKLLNLKNEDQA